MKIKTAFVFAAILGLTGCVPRYRYITITAAPSVPPSGDQAPFHDYRTYMDWCTNDKKISASECLNIWERNMMTQEAEKTEDRRAAFDALMGSADRLGHSSDAAMDHMLDSSRQFNRTLSQMESERRSIDPSPAFEQGDSFHRSTLPYGIQGTGVPIEELDKYVPHD